MMNKTKEQLLPNGLYMQSSYRTHTWPLAEWLHQMSDGVLWPARYSIQLLASTIEPNPGADKKGLAHENATYYKLLAGGLLLAPIGIISFPFGYLPRWIDSYYRPNACYLINDKLSFREHLKITEKLPLHIRTHNVAQVPTAVSNATNLRDPIQRAHELVDYIIKDPHKPQVICFQEAPLFNEEANRILVEGLKNHYKYIIHHVAPHFSGFTSGAMIASQYQIKFEDFQRFDHMLETEALAPRGILKVSLQTMCGKKIMLYNIHTQSLPSEERATRRLKQFKDLVTLITNDCKKDQDCYPIVLGDFNTSRITEWGEDNCVPENQAEKAILDFLDEHFIDPFLNDHDVITGKRTSGTAHFLTQDAQRIYDSSAVSALTEPGGTWYYGAFGNVGKKTHESCKKERKQHQRDIPQQRINYKTPTWGTKKFNESTAQFSSRFDMILFFKSRSKPLKANVEIRHIACEKNVQSAPSDHLPVDACIFLK